MIGDSGRSSASIIPKVQAHRPDENGGNAEVDVHIKISYKTLVLVFISLDIIRWLINLLIEAISQV